MITVGVLGLLPLLALPLLWRQEQAPTAAPGPVGERVAAGTTTP
jgi:hypothetical protein